MKKDRSLFALQKKPVAGVFEQVQHYQEDITVKVCYAQAPLAVNTGSWNMYLA